MFRFRQLTWELRQIIEAARIRGCLILLIVILCAIQMECPASYISELAIFNGPWNLELPVFGSEEFRGGSVDDH